MALSDDLRAQLTALADSAARIRDGARELAAQVAEERQAAEQAAEQKQEGE
jgi:hypothetical protein